tara:strand:- start:169 stop:441 length:273 start_codon:yes stop_codon:yes gene_type:complete
MDKEMLMEALAEEECLLADGYDDALIGITEGMNPVAVYNTDKCIEILMRDDELTHEEALDHFYYNTVGAYVGEKTPLFLRMIDGEYYRTL